MPDALITAAQKAELLVNGARAALGHDIDPPPVVKLFTPDAGASWLLTEFNPNDLDQAVIRPDEGAVFWQARGREPPPRTRRNGQGQTSWHGPRSRQQCPVP